MKFSKVLLGLSKSIGILSSICAVVAGILLAIMLTSTILDIASRSVLGSPVRGMTEYSAVVLVMITFLGMPYTWRVGGHVSVGLVFNRLGPRYRRALLGVGLLAILPVIGVWFWSSLDVAVDSLQSGEFRMAIVRVPVWPARFVIVGAAFLLVLEVCISILAEVFGFDEAITYSNRSVSDRT